jgi:hypothetical protein
MPTQAQLRVLLWLGSKTKRRQASNGIEPVN